LIFLFFHCPKKKWFWQSLPKNMCFGHLGIKLIFFKSSISNLICKKTLGFNQGWRWQDCDPNKTKNDNDHLHPTHGNDFRIYNNKLGFSGLLLNYKLIYKSQFFWFNILPPYMCIQSCLLNSKYKSGMAFEEKWRRWDIMLH